MPASVPTTPITKITYFSRRLEVLNLIFPLLFFGFIAWELLADHRFSGTEKSYGTFIAKILFLNHVHVYFSFALILFSPEMRSWAHQKNIEHSFFIPRWLAVFVGVFTIYFWGLPFLKANTIDPRIYDGIIALTAIVGLHHNFSQTLGLSLGYNHAFRILNSSTQSAESFLSLPKLEYLERLLARLMMASQFTRMLWAAIDPTPQLLFNILGGFTIASAAILMASGYFYPREFTNKKIFMIRYALFALMPFSFIALIGLLSVHGIEYLCVFRQMQDGSIQKNRLNRKLVLIGTILFVGSLTTIAIFGRSAFGYWVTPLLPKNSELALYLGSFALAGSFLHYHVDSLMFKMKDPKTRTVVSGLLFSPIEDIGLIKLYSERQPTSRSFEESNRLKRVAP